MTFASTRSILTILALLVSFSKQQYSTFTGENGCEVRIPFLESCRKAQISAEKSGQESTFPSLEASLKRIESTLQEFSIQKKSAIPNLFAEAFQNHPSGLESVELEDTLKENCWAKVSHCHKDQTSLQFENVGLNKLLLGEKLRADRADARAEELVANCTEKIYYLEERLDKCDEKRADKLGTIATLEQSLTRMESSVGMMQEKHEVQIASLESNMTALQELIRARDATLHILRNRIVELTKKLASKNRAFQVQCGQQREAPAEPSGIVEISKISCTDGELTPTCVLAAINTNSDARCLFRQRNSADYNWLYQSHKEMSRRMRSKTPTENKSVCDKNVEYFYLDYSRLAIGQKAQLITDLIQIPGQRQCFTFWYMLHYKLNYGKLFVQVKVKDRYTADIWQDYSQGTQGEWMKAYFDIPATVSDQGFQILLVAEGNGPGYVAINSVTLTPGKCA